MSLIGFLAFLSERASKITKKEFFFRFFLENFEGVLEVLQILIYEVFGPALIHFAEPSRQSGPCFIWTRPDWVLHGPATGPGQV